MHYYYWLLLVLIGTSCVTHQEIMLLEADNPAADSLVQQTAYEAITIKPGDRLNILVSPKYGQDPSLVAPYNINQEGPTSYLVDASGSITFPSIGQIRLGGMSTDQARQEVGQVIISLSG